MNATWKRTIPFFFLILRSSISLVPSTVPTSFKSSEPSTVPSIPVLVANTALPSFLPSSTASEQPSSTSLIPTAAPSAAINVPTLTPSDIPTLSSSPTDIPSVSLNPTFKPSVHPTLSKLPSEQPTRTESSIPSELPSYYPSEQSSDHPSSHPSILPTDEGIIKRTPDIEMIINGISVEMQTDEIKSYFERTTSNHILFYWSNMTKPIPFFSIATQIKSQNVISPPKVRYLSEHYYNNMNDRNLQNDRRSLQLAQLEVTYTHELEIATDDLDTMITSDIYLLPFQDDGGQQFLNTLIANDPSSEKYFQYAEDVSVRVVVKSSSKITTIIISVSVAVGVIFIVALWYVFVRGKCKRSTENEDVVVDLNAAPSVSFNNDDDDVSEGPYGKDDDEGLSYADFSVEQQHHQEIVRTWKGTGKLAETEILRVVDLPNEDSNSDDDDASGSFSA